PFPSSEIRWSARSPSVTVRGHSCSRRRISRATTRSTTATCDPPGSDRPRCETPSRSSRSTRTAAAPPRSSGEPMNGRALAPLYVALAAFTLALFPLLLDLLFTARAGRIGVLLAVPPLLLVWTNLHGGYALGLALVGIFTLDALLTRRNWAAFAITASTAFAASLVDPGSLGLGAAAAHATAPPRFIVEES